VCQMMGIAHDDDEDYDYDDVVVLWEEAHEETPLSNDESVGSDQLTKWLCVCVCACVRACVRACVHAWRACMKERDFLLHWYS
jgi:hypothetical protein